MKCKTKDTIFLETNTKLAPEKAGVLEKSKHNQA